MIKIQYFIDVRREPPQPYGSLVLQAFLVFQVRKL